MTENIRSIPLSEDLFTQKIYWLHKLSGELPETNLIADYLRPVAYSGKNQFISFELSEKLSEAIFKLTNRSYLSIYLVLLSALKILLNRYTGNDDVIVGSPVYKIGGDEKLNNNFVTLRSQVADSLTFKDFLLQVKDTAIGAYSHQNYPFDELVGLLKLPQSENRCSIFDIILLLENIHNQPCLAETKNDITFSFVVTENGLKGKVEYSSLLFKEETINQAIAHYINILEVALGDINIPLAQLDFLTPSDKKQLLEEFNDNAKSYPVTKTIHALFAEQVEKTPDRIAVVFENAQLKYCELNDQANQLALFLRKLGITNGSFVGILKERNPNYLIAILAILKAGAAYVPIDVTYPADRIRYMLLNSEVQVLLTECSSLNILPEVISECSCLQSIICLDAISDESNQKITGVNLYQQSDFQHLPTAIDAINRGIDAAYMIYTSGSTGFPKGAIIRHGGAINHIYAQFDALNLTENLRFLQSAPASSDISVWQFLAPILIGGTTVIVDTETVCNPEKLFHDIKDKKVTIIEIVPVVLRSLLEYTSQLSNDQRLLPDLKWMMVTGESVSVEMVNQWLSLYPSIKVVNAYGPTEAADDITQLIIDKPLEERTVSIGKPLANLNIYILDRKMQLLPVGVPGEICVSGFGVGVGYWKNEKSTQLSFVPNPFPNTAKCLPGTNKDLIYKTGDLGRWLPDGNIEFLGRIDHQVKIRGFRIELGEIEALLSQHPAVRETAIAFREDVSNQKRLVAYVVPSPDNQVQSDLVSQLRSFLKQKLPEYMVPSAFVLLEALPLTPSGKVDRRALPAPDQTRLAPQETFMLPRTPVEEILTQVWEQVLGIERVGIHDNFFELGGDSLLSIQVIAKAHQAGVQLTPKQMFQHQTIADLATVADTTGAIQAEQGLVVGSLPLTPIQHSFFEQNLLDPHHWNQSLLLEVEPDVDPKLLEQAVQQLSIHHDALRLRFIQTESGWQQINANSDDLVPFSYVDLSNLPPEKQKFALETAATELQSSLNLSQGPLIRAAFFKLGEKTSRLLLIIHHLAVDGVSWRILVEDLQTIYQHHTQANASDTGTLALPLKTTSFKQWSQQLLEYARSKALLQLDQGLRTSTSCRDMALPCPYDRISHSLINCVSPVDYWLAEARKSVSRLPVDFPGGSNTVGSARILSVSLSVAETKALLQKVPAAYRTQINDVLLTALVQAFAQWTGEQSLLVNLEGHGREEIFDNVDLSRTVGWFTSVFPVLLLGDSDPGEALKAIKEQLRSIPHRGIDYGILRYLSNDPFIVESLRSLPQAQVCFNYLGQFDQTLSSPLFNWSSEPRGIERSLRDYRSELLEINGFVVGGQLQLDWTYSQSVHHQSTIEALAQGFIEALRSLIAHCQSPEAGGYTPSDFPLAKLDQQTLDELLVQSQIEDIYPLSPIQQGMLFHTLYDPDSGIYCEQFSCTLKGNLNISAFKQAWERVVDLYPVLRTSFYGEIDTPLQVVHRQVELPWEQQDWRGSLTDQERLEAVLKGDSQGFDLSQAPLMRLILIQLTDNTNLFIWSHHHLLLDGWSMPIVFKDAIAFYQAFSQGQDLNPKRPRPYRDYIAWLQQQDLSKAEVFWQQMLKGFTTPTPLEINPVYQKLPSLKESENKQQIQLSKATAAALLLFTKQHQLTLNTLIQGTWALLLNHYSSAEDVVFGSTVSGRPPNLAGSESIVGVFINTLPVRVQLIPEDSFVSLLKKIQSQQVEARQYEHTPLVQLQKWSDMPRDLPLFESIVVFQNYPVDPSLRQGFREFEFGNIRSSSKNNYPLTVRVLLPELSLQILYDPCRFEPDAIAQILEHFQILLHRVLEQPDANIRALKEALIEGDKQQQILKQKDFQAVRRQKIGNVRRKTISVATEQLERDND